MKIVELRRTIIGRHPIVRIVTDDHGHGEMEFPGPTSSPRVLLFPDALIGDNRGIAFEK